MFYGHVCPNGRLNGPSFFMDIVHVYRTSGIYPSTLLHGYSYDSCAILYSKQLKCKCTPVDLGSIMFGLLCWNFLCEMKCTNSNYSSLPNVVDDADGDDAMNMNMITEVIRNDSDN